jgi:Protein of unknown function DUF72
MPKAGNVRVGVGGWTFAPWRGEFYPKGLAHAKELAYASCKLTTIEINGTFHRTQTPATFAKWRKQVSDGFVFSVKGPRYVVQKRALAEAGEALEFFFKSGVSELGVGLPNAARNPRRDVRRLHPRARMVESIDQLCRIGCRGEPCPNPWEVPPQYE